MSENQINLSTVPDQTPQPASSPPPRSEALQQQPPRSLPDNHDSPIADLESQQVISNNAQQQTLQWKSTILAFCFTAALEISLQFAQNNSQPSLSLSLVSVGIVLTFSLLLLAKFIRSSSSNEVSKALGKASFVVATTTFYYLVTIPFPAVFKCAIWSISAISLLILAIYNRYFHNVPA